MHRLVIRVLLSGLIAVLVLGCTSSLRQPEQIKVEDCVCDEEAIWKLILSYRGFTQPRTRDGAIVIDNAYCIDSQRGPYMTFFKCDFFYWVLSPHRDTSKHQDVELAWKRAQFVARYKDVRLPIGVTHLADSVDDIFFSNDPRLSDESTPMFNYAYKPKRFYVYQFDLRRPTDTLYTVCLDEASGEYGNLFTIDLRTCKLVDYNRYLYDGLLTCDMYDWTELIDFNTTLDSFYQYQYLGVLQKLDSIKVTQNPHIPESHLYRNFPQFKDMW